MSTDRSCLKHLLVLPALMALSVLSTGCGVRNTRVSTESSLSSSASSIPSVCNMKSVSTAPALGVATSIYRGYKDALRVKLTELPAAFLNQTSTQTIEFRFGSVASGTNVIKIDNAPRVFRLAYMKNGVEYPLMNYIPTLNYAVMNEAKETLARDYGMSLELTAMKENLEIILVGVEDDLKMMSVELANGAGPVKKLELLIPVFEANFELFAASKPAILHPLHPFKESTLELTQSSTDEMCARFEELRPTFY